MEFMADSVLAGECLNNVGFHQRYLLSSHLIEPLQTMQSITWPGSDGSIPAAQKKKSLRSVQPMAAVVATRRKIMLRKHAMRNWYQHLPD